MRHLPGCFIRSIVMIDSIIENRALMGRLTGIKDVFDSENPVEYMQVYVSHIGCDHRHYFSIDGIPGNLLIKEFNYIFPIEISKNQVIVNQGFPYLLV